MFFNFAGERFIRIREIIMRDNVNPDEAKKGDISSLQGKYSNKPIIDTALYDFAHSLKMTPYKKTGNLPMKQSYHQGISYLNNRKETTISRITTPTI